MDLPAVRSCKTHLRQFHYLTQINRHHPPPVPDSLVFQLAEQQLTTHDHVEEGIQENRYAILAVKNRDTSMPPAWARKEPKPDESRGDAHTD